MTRSFDEKFAKELATHESRMKSRAQYRTYAKLHMTFAILMAIGFIFLQSSRAEPSISLFAFLTLTNFLMSYKHIGTCQMITAVEFIESNKDIPSKES